MKHLRDKVEKSIKVMQGKDLFWHSLVRPKLAVVVSKGATLLTAMQDSLIMADLQAIFSGRQRRGAHGHGRVVRGRHLPPRGQRSRWLGV